MSEILNEPKFTKENSAASNQYESNQVEKSVTPSFRTFRSMRPRNDNDNDANVEVAQVIDRDQPIEMISADDIHSNAVHDEAINKSYEDATLAIGDVNQHAEHMHNVLVEQVKGEIKGSKKRFEDRREQIDAIADSKIAAIEQMRSRAIQAELVRQAGSIAESKRMREEADNLLASNLDAISKIEREIKSGQTHQSRLEQQRDEAIAEFNDLVTRKDQREADLIIAEANLSKFSKKLSKQEARRDELFDEETTLKTDERTEREELSRPEIDALMVRFGAMPDSATQELPQGIIDSIKSIKDSVESAELVRILGKLEHCHEAQDHNARSITYLGDMIGESELQISTVNDEIEELTARLIQLKTKLDGALTEMAIELQVHSAEAVRVSGIFDTILRGDTTVVAGNSIPGPLHSVYDNMVAYKKAIARSNEDRQDDWEPPVFETNTFRAFGDYLDGDPALALEGEVAIQETIERGAEQLRNANPLEGFIAKIATRGFMSRGMDLKLQGKSEEISE